MRAVLLLALITAVHAQLLSSSILDDKPTTNSRVREVVVIGERHTGTNFLEQFIKKCIKANGIGPRLRMGLIADKHKLQPVPPQDETWGEGAVLVLGTARNAYDWSHALWKTCYCCTAMQNMTYERFVAAPYTNSEWWPDPMCRFPDVVFTESNRPFKSVLESRRLKLQNLLDMRASRAFVGVELFRLEDVWAAGAGGGSAVDYLKGRLAKYNMPFLRACREEHVNAGADARKGWLEKKVGHTVEFSAEDKVAGSILMSYDRLAAGPQQGEQPGQQQAGQQGEGEKEAAALRARVAAVNPLLDAAFEAALGYGCVGEGCPAAATAAAAAVAVAPQQQEQQQQQGPAL